MATVQNAFKVFLDDVTRYSYSYVAITTGLFLPTCVSIEGFSSFKNCLIGKLSTRFLAVEILKFRKFTGFFLLLTFLDIQTQISQQLRTRICSLRSQPTEFGCLMIGNATVLFFACGRC